MVADFLVGIPHTLAAYALSVPPIYVMKISAGLPAAGHQRVERRLRVSHKILRVSVPDQAAAMGVARIIARVNLNRGEGWNIQHMRREETETRRLQQRHAVGPGRKAIWLDRSHRGFQREALEFVRPSSQFTARAVFRQPLTSHRDSHCNFPAQFRYIQKTFRGARMSTSLPVAGAKNRLPGPKWQSDGGISRSFRFPDREHEG